MPEAVVHVKLLQDTSGLEFLLPYSKGSEIKGGDIEISPEGVTIGTATIKSEKAKLSKGAKKIFEAGSGVDAALSKINISLKGNPSWSAVVDKLKLDNSGGFRFNIDNNPLEVKDIFIGDCLLSSSSVNDITKFVSSNPTAWLSTSGVKYYSKTAIWQGFNASYDAGRNRISMDSFNYRPLASRDSAIAGSPYQIDYLNFNCSNIALYGFDIIKYFKEQALIIQKASISRPSLSIYRDKLPPYLSGIIKKLFVARIIDIRQPVSINQLEISDGEVSYIEKSAKTRLEGNLLLTHLNGSLNTIKNRNLQPRDSLSLIVTGHLLNAPSFALKINESYLDPLSGFIMTLRIEPAPIAFLNPLLAPLSSIKFTSGKIDTFYMNAVGNENSALGEMKFYYHGLHLQLLKNGEMSKSTITKHVGSLLVNTFIVKTNNERRRGLIYFKRLKDRSFFNYMNKIIFSGVATSIGAKRNNQYRKSRLKDTETFENP